MNSGRLIECCREISAPVTAWTLDGICAAGTPKPGRGVTPITSTDGVSSCSAGFCAEFWAKPAAGAAARPTQRRTGPGSLVQARNVVRQVLDVLLAEGLGNAGHATGIVGARACLEGSQLLDDVFRVLARDARNFVLSGESSEVAHGAQSLVRFFLPAADAPRIRPERERFRLLRGEVLGEIEHVLARELGDEGLHRRF